LVPSLEFSRLGIFLSQSSLSFHQDRFAGAHHTKCHRAFLDYELLILHVYSSEEGGF
jgi:hypothetical protein